MASRGVGGNGGSGGNGGAGGGGGGANSLAWSGPPTLQNVLVAQNLAAAAGLGGTAGAGGGGMTGHGASGSPGAGGLDGSGPDLLGDFTSNGCNLIGQDDGNTGFTDGVLGDIVGSSGAPLDPLLGPLANNGGPTFTCALLSGSPALDAGDDTLLGAPWSVTTDQRNLPRDSGSHVDIGAFELQWACAPICLAAFPAANGAIRMSLTNVPGASLTLLAATNMSLPLSDWVVLGSVPEIAPGQFQFVDPAPASLPTRFYRLRCP
jgi:hypothetical protein